jgi:hypothetical protein
MAERIEVAPLTVAEHITYTKLQDGTTVGGSHDDIPYVVEDADLFFSIGLHQVFPDRFEPSSAVEPEDPVSRITGLATALDVMIMSHERRSEISEDAYELMGVRLPDGNYFNFMRTKLDDEVHVTVEHLLKIETAPTVEAEKYTLTNKGSFLRVEYINIPDKEKYDTETTAWYNTSCNGLEPETAASLDHFSGLMQPFLGK